MLEPVDVLRFVAYATTAWLIIAPMLLCAGQMYFLNARVKDDVPLHRHVYVVLRYTPIHIKTQTDWRQFVIGTAKIAGVVTLATFLLTLTAVGFLVVF